MSVQDSTFKTTHVMDNEIVKANDFEFAFEQLVENVSKATQMILESNQDFVINGKVLPDTGMNVRVSPIYGVCKSTGIPFGRTEATDETIGFEGSSSGRRDILEVQGDWETYDNQQRAFNDPETDTKTYQYVDTKKLMRPVYRVKKGTDGSSTAPEVDEGWVKLAEVQIRAGATSILATDIFNITADIAGLDNDDWTTEADITYNIGYLSEVNERFRVQHNEDGTHKNNVIDTDSLNIGTGTKQVNGNVVPIGAAVDPSIIEGISASDSIYSALVKVATVVSSIYASYMKYGEFNFKGKLAISDLVDTNQLKKPISIEADGSGNAYIKVDGTTVLSINSSGKLTTNGFSASHDNDIITKKVTDAISTDLTTVSNRVTAVEERLASNEIYTNKVLSTDRFNVASLTINAATTANITLSGTQTIDGVALAVNQKVLVKNQSLPKNNGIYNVESSAWTRPTDYNTPNKLKGKIFNVTSGTSNGGKMFYIPTETFQNGSAFGSDDINFVEFLGSVAKLANKLVMRNSSGAANLDVNGNVTGNLTGNVVGNYGTCSTVAATAEKAVSCANFTLASGAEITVKFTVTNTANNPTLNVNSTGAKPIYYRGSAISAGYLAANRTYTFRYDGTSYNLVGDLDTNTTYSNVSKTAAGLCPQLPNESTTTKYLRQDGSWQVPPNTTYSNTSKTAAGLCPQLPNESTTTKYLRQDGSWQVPPNTTYSNATQSAAGLMSSTDKTKLDGIASGAQVNSITGVKGNAESSYRTGNVNITPANIGLGNVNNTADTAKTVLSAACQSLYLCGTDSGTAAKTLGIPNFSLFTRCRIIIYFANANTAANPTLNVNNTGAKPITIGSASNATTPTAASATSTAWNGIKANILYDAYYDGTYWRLTPIDGNLCGIKAYYFSSTSGYIVYTNGLMIEWGKVDASSSNTNVTFPIPYTTGYTPLFGYQSDNSNSPNFRHLGVYSLYNSTLSLTGFTLYGSSVIRRFWMTIGY